MASAMLGRKLGMTRYFTEEGVNIPVTVIQAGPCVVTQVKTEEVDGYSAVQIGYEDLAPRRSTMPVIGHDHRAGTAPKRFHRELRTDDVDVELGDTITVDCFEDVQYVDICGRSKGKGFQGGMKRHNFSGLEASHGVKRRHRSVGSIGGHSANLGTGPKLKKGKRMPGHMGDVNVTARSLPVVAIDSEKNLLLVKGSVPGPNNSCVFIRSAVRLNRKKSSKGNKGK
ncbi:MAG: 50S ribosomal protein L3 [Phycisphaerae bacterium]|nr:50S ribosomal protein L3 [Phycisphaerae bacterium]|tara:strand:- start:43 stop:720 length:678 start_codon:yes stop_codon:yes gene_type:complete